jgi:NADPH2:quinone reductase
MQAQSLKSEQMNAIIINAFGNAENSADNKSVFDHVRNAPVPTLQAGHLLVRVAASSVNPVDYKIRSGRAIGIAPVFPAVLHGDVAGEVVAVGDDVQGFAPGDAVYACAGGVKGLGGALAEYMLVDAVLAAHKPSSLSWAEAASLPLAAITAFEGLFDRARVKAGDRVLVYGGTGGVGHLAVQFAKAAGAFVVATVSSDEKAEIVRSLGADGVINHRTESVEEYIGTWTNGQGFDIVFDTVGGENFVNSFKAARFNGQVIGIQAGASSANFGSLQGRGLTLHFVFMLIPMLHNTGRKRHGEILRETAHLVETGKLRPLLHNTVFPFEEVGKAHALLEQGQAIGKIALINTWQ